VRCGEKSPRALGIRCCTPEPSFDRADFGLLEQMTFGRGAIAIDRSAYFCSSLRSVDTLTAGNALVGAPPCFPLSNKP
jgi:hypothetical protein